MKDIELPPLPEPTALGMDFDKGWDGVRAYGYTEDDMASYARAAVEADRAQRVPDVDALSNFIREIDGAHRFGAGALAERICEWLASTPAPAQQEPATPMDAHRASYFMRRFLHEEKMLGPNEQAALHFTIAALEAMESADQHQEPPKQERQIAEALRRRGLTLVKTANGYDVLELGQITAQASGPQQERKPMTDEQDRALCEAFCNAASDEYFKARPQLDSDVNRRIFYAGHRNAWLEWQTAHGIKE